jgi:hypothetical protein
VTILLLVFALVHLAVPLALGFLVRRLYVALVIWTAVSAVEIVDAALNNGLMPLVIGGAIAGACVVIIGSTLRRQRHDSVL